MEQSISIKRVTAYLSNGSYFPASLSISIQKSNVVIFFLANNRTNVGYKKNLPIYTIKVVSLLYLLLNKQWLALIIRQFQGIV